MSLLANDLSGTRLKVLLRRFEPRQRWIGIGRTIIALAQFFTLAFTPTDALFQTILGQAPAPACVGMNVASAFCVGGDVLSTDVRQWILAALLLVVASGYRPRYTVFLHAWISFSIAGSIALPDGGDQAARIVCLILIPIGLADNRTWQWSHPSRAKPINPSLQALSLAGGMVILRIQIALIYFQSAIAKLFVDDWANGSAEYYILRDKMFGASGIVGGDLLQTLTQNPWMTAAMTWGAIVVECSIAVLILGQASWRRKALAFAIFLHLGIIVTMGLWSFALTMIGAVMIAAAPDWVAPPKRDSQLQPEESRPVGESLARDGSELNVVPGLIQ